MTGNLNPPPAPDRCLSPGEGLPRFLIISLGLPAAEPLTRARCLEMNALAAAIASL